MATEKKSNMAIEIMFANFGFRFYLKTTAWYLDMAEHTDRKEMSMATISNMFFAINLCFKLRF